ITLPSFAIRRNPVGTNVELPCSAALAEPLSRGMCTPRINPPPARTLDLRKWRRLQFTIVLTSHLLAPSTAPRDEWRVGCADTFHTGRCFPSSLCRCLHRWAVVFRAAARQRSSAVPIGNSRTAARLRQSKRAAVDDSDRARGPRWLLLLCLLPATAARRRIALPRHRDVQCMRRTAPCRNRTSSLRDRAF